MLGMPSIHDQAVRQTTCIIHFSLAGIQLLYGDIVVEFINLSIKALTMGSVLVCYEKNPVWIDRVLKSNSQPVRRQIDIEVIRDSAGLAHLHGSKVEDILEPERLSVHGITFGHLEVEKEHFVWDSKVCGNVLFCSKSVI